MRPLALARLVGWAFFLVRIVVLDTIELVRGHALHDYASFHAAACAIRAGLSPYKPDELAFGSMSCGMGNVHPYFYPPLLAESLLPVTFVSPWAARLIWHLVGMGALIGAVHLLDRWLRERPRGDELSASLMMIAACFWPLRESQMMGQVNTVVLLLLTVWWTKREKSELAVIALAGAAAIKMSPALLFLVPLLEKKWRELAYGAASTAAMVLVSCALIGKRGFEFLFSVVASFVPGAKWHSFRLPIDIFGNESIAAVLIRNTHTLDPQRLPRHTTIIQVGILVGMLGLALFRYRRIAAEARAVPLIILMIVAPTYAWEHHLTFALLAIAMLLAVAPDKRWPFFVIGVTAVALMADRLDYFVLPGARYPRWFVGWARSPKLLPLLAVFALGLFATRATPAAAPETSPEPTSPTPPPDPPETPAAAPAPPSVSPKPRRRGR